MPDLLIKLYELPPLEPVLNELKEKGIIIRRPIGPENYSVIGWINEHFDAYWAGEAENAFFNSTKTIFIALKANNEGKNEMLGFACYDATMKGFFGPTGVKPEARHMGIGKGLLLACLHGLYNDGYGYGIIGGAGPVDFYQRVCNGNAVVIEGSVPGIYKGML